MWLTIKGDPMCITHNLAQAQSIYVWGDNLSGERPAVYAALGQDLAAAVCLVQGTVFEMDALIANIQALIHSPAAYEYDPETGELREV